MENAAITAVLFGLAAALSFGISDFFGAKASKQFGGITTSFFATCISTAIYIPLYFLFFRDHTHIVASAVWYATAAGAISTLALAAFYKGLEIGPVSIVSPLGSMYPLVTTVLLITIFDTHLRFVQGVGIVLVAIGASVASGLLDSLKTGTKMGVGPVLGLVAAVCWGTNFALLAQAIHTVGWQFATLIQLAASTVVFALIYPFMAHNERAARASDPISTNRSTLSKRLVKILKSRYVIGASILQIVAVLSVNAGIGRAGHLAAITVAVSACYPIVTVLLALTHLKERFHPVPFVGTVVGITGIVVLSLG